MAKIEKATQSRKKDLKPDTQLPSQTDRDGEIENLTPRQIVEHLDRHIIGQDDAKRAVAVALRNRYRRQQVPEEMRREIQPKNILMIGPTGVGKTEIARRVATIVRAPFIKVEATRFTEVGYVGKDVDSIIRDLVEISVSEVYRGRMETVQGEADTNARGRLLEIMTDQALQRRSVRRRATTSGLETVDDQERARREAQAEQRRRSRERRRLETLLEQEKLEDEEIELEVEAEVEPGRTDYGEYDFGGQDDDVQDALAEMFDEMFPPRRIRRRVSVRDARRILANEESVRMIDFDSVVRDAIRRVEDGGVVFIDEIDKTVATDENMSADVSAAGVQRDLLPMVEGTLIATRYGSVRTEHVLFIASGAFHQVRPSDLIPEIQGRFPVRVELQQLSEDDLYAILTQPDQALARQYEALVATEGVALSFADDGLRRIAELAAEINARQDDIGARRLQTLLERVLEDVLFDAPDGACDTVEVTRQLVDERVGEIVDDEDLSLYILNRVSRQDASITIQEYECARSGNCDRFGRNQHSRRACQRGWHGGTSGICCNGG